MVWFLDVCYLDVVIGENSWYVTVDDGAVSCFLLIFVVIWISVPIRITARSASGRVCFLVASTRWVVVYIWSIFTTVQLVRAFLRGSIMCLRLESAMRFILILASSTSFFFSLGVAGLGLANSAFISCSALSFSSISRCSCCLGCCSHLLESLCIGRLFRLSSSLFPSHSSFCLFPSWPGSLFPYQLGLLGIAFIAFTSHLLLPPCRTL